MSDFVRASDLDADDVVAYRVTCEDCDLVDEFGNERIARGRKLAHWEDRLHVATVTEVYNADE